MPSIPDKNTPGFQDPAENICNLIGLDNGPEFSKVRQGVNSIADRWERAAKKYICVVEIADWRILKTLWGDRIAVGAE
jgi:hypothetical protein